MKFFMSSVITYAVEQLCRMAVRSIKKYFGIQYQPQPKRSFK